MTRPTRPVIYTRIPEPDPGLLARASEFGVADLHEGMGIVAGRMCLMKPDMRPIQQGKAICGPAVTAWNFPGDNLAIHMALHVAKAGQVLVFTNGGGHQGALWGDVACGFAKKKGVAGAVVHGAVRDTDAIRDLDFPVWSTAISPEHPEKRGPAAVNVPIVVDGVLVEPGDVICADADGVLVIPRALLQHAVEGAERRAQLEIGIRKRIADGDLPFDIFGFGEILDQAGIEMKDTTWEEDQ
jgi:4-hydroxy-4-methyl-2-oxoglutarate aldolase